MITYGGYPLLLEDEAGELPGFFDRFLSLDQLHCFGDEPVARKSPKNSTRANQLQGVGLGLPNYPPDPPPKLNSLYWPTGASRWSRVYCLCDDATKKLIVRRAHGLGSALGSVLGSSSLPLEFKMGDPAGVHVTTNLYLLPPRPAAPTRNAFTLWLLPLVDARYWWQFKDAGDLALDESDTWGGLYSTLGSALGATISASAIPAAYLIPDPIELSRRYANAATMLDAVAHSVGQRIVRFTNGTVAAMDADAAEFYYDTNSSADEWTLSAGDDFSSEVGSLPASVRVAFPKYSWGVTWHNGEKYTYANSTSHGPSSTTKLFFSSAYADFKIVDPESDTLPVIPVNETKLEDLAAQIASDYTAWTAKDFDLNFNAVKAWESTGFDNFTEWTFGRLGSDGQREAKTRVQSMPHNFGVEQLLHQDPDLWSLDKFQYVVLDEDLEADSWADATLWDKDGEVSPTRTIRVYDALGVATAADTKGFVFWHADDNRWYFLIASGSSGQLVQVFSSDGTQGRPIAANASCVWPGRKISRDDAETAFCSGDEYEAGDDIWIVVIDNPGGSAQAKVKLIDGDRYIGISVGTLDVGGDERPLYAVRKAITGGIVHFTLYTDLDASTPQAEAVVIRLGQGAPATVNQNIVVKNPPIPDTAEHVFEAPSGTLGKASYWPEEDAWYIDWLVCADEEVADPPPAGGEAAALAPQNIQQQLAARRPPQPFIQHYVQQPRLLPS